MVTLILHHGIPAIAVSYNAMVSDPSEVVKALAAFLGREQMAARMADALDPDLYRSRNAE